MSADQLNIDILLYVAMAEEFDALSEALTEDLKTELDVIELADLALHVFSVDVPSPALGKAVKLGIVPAGKMGIARAANVVSAVLDRSNCNDVVVLGIAGSLSADLQPGDVLIPDNVTEYLANSAAINDAETGQWVFQTSGNPHLPTPRLLNRFQLFKSISKDRFQHWEADCATRYGLVATEEIRAKMETSGFVMRAEIKLFAGDDRKLASGPAVGKGDAFVKWLRSDVDRKFDAIEMESAGVFDAVTIRTSPPRVLAIRGISDFADERKKLLEDGTKGQFRAVAAKNALSLLLRGIEAGFFLPSPASIEGAITPLEHWDLILSQREEGDPPLPAALFTTARADACNALEGAFSGKCQRLLFFSESEHDVDDFIAAYLSTLEGAKAQEYSNRCLFINNEEAWRTASKFRTPHILVASPRLGLDSEHKDLQSVATKNGHVVVIPLCGALPGDNPEITGLRSPSRLQIRTILKEAEFSEVRAGELAGIGGGRISALRRHLLGLGSVPPYVHWNTARGLAQAALVGQWNAKSSADVRAMEELLGKSYREWVEALRPDTLRSDSPLMQHSEKWQFVARGEAWNSLGSRLTDDDLDRFQTMAISVLGERDPKFDLPKEERFAASIHEKVLVHSHLIRNGIAETLALMGSRPKALSACSDGKANVTAVLVVRSLLNKANWDRWASLDSLMPLLAEAAPDEFLDAVESVLTDLSNTPFHKIFEEEGGGGVGGSNYMSGLLWALETLAWHPPFLSRVSVILADVASFDPGGSWANRPSNTLADIFLPWHVQTTASFEKRKSAVEAVIKEQPAVGWKLLLALLPHNRGFTSGCRRPVWREFIPRDWKEDVLRTEYWEQIAAYTDLAVTLAKIDSGKLCELIKRLSDLPKSAHENLLGHLASDAVVSLPEADRLPIWESLDELARHHRKYSDADWSMPEDAVNRIAETAQTLAPTSPEFKYQYLFGGRDSDLYDEKGNYEEQQKRLDEARQAAISEITGSGGLDAALKFAANVSSPYEVGRALGVIASDEIENSILPLLLCSEDDSVIRVVAGFVWARFWKRKTEWVDAVLERAWSPENHAKFLTLLPFEEEIWQRVAMSLTATHEALYWKSAKVTPYGPDRDLTIAIEKLLEHGREGAAVMCVARTADNESRFDAALATRALLAVLESERGIEEMSNYDTVELIRHLQESATTDKDALFRIEWNFLPWLDRFSSGSPVTLENRLASDPAFFAEAIGLVYRSKNISEDDHEELDEHKSHLARNAYKLLDEWGRCPGRQSDGSFSAEVFNAWLAKARRLTEESGHAEVAQIQIGHVLTCAPPDSDGLWIHNTVAAALNLRDTGEMRSGFTTQLFNERGVHGFTHGKEEHELAEENRKKAEALDSKGYTRFATAMREFAEQYERQAERESKREPFED